MVATGRSAYMDQVGQRRLILRISEDSNSEAAASRDVSWASVLGDRNKLAGSRALSILGVSAQQSLTGSVKIHLHFSIRVWSVLQDTRVRQP